jgi:hypothetical protein
MKGQSLTTEQNIITIIITIVIGAVRLNKNKKLTVLAITCCSGRTLVACSRISANRL